MLDERPSITAQRAALRRAAHQVLDSPRVFDDPLALRIAGITDEAKFIDELRRKAHPVGRFLRAFIAVRSRYAEDELAKAIRRGVRQYVIVGAGLDTFAYRKGCDATALRIFEVDHPATQAWKRGRLREAGVSVPESLTFAAVNFEKQTLAGGLQAAGFAADAAAFFSWLGVVPYLPREAIVKTLAFVASRPAGSDVVFDYATKPTSPASVQQAVFERISQHVAALGEPWVTFFEPDVLKQELSGLGFRTIENLGQEELNQRYFTGRSDGLRVGGLGYVVKAGT